MNKYLKIDCFTGLKIPNLMLYVAMFLENVSLPVQNTDTFLMCMKKFVHFTSLYSYFEKRCRKKMCTRQSRMAIWDVTNTLFLTLWLSNLLLLLSFSTRKHMPMASCAFLSNFFEEQLTQNHPTTFLQIGVYGSMT